MTGLNTNGIIIGILNTIGKPKIIGSLISNTPGTNAKFTTFLNGDLNFPLTKVGLYLENSIV